MFRGPAEVNLDAKGRMAIPTRFRSHIMDQSNGQLVVTIDPTDSCLLVYPANDWLEVEQKVMALPSGDEGVRRFQRMLVGHATEMEMDSNGRILLTTILREHGQLLKQLRLVGQGKKIEIWDCELWKRNYAPGKLYHGSEAVQNISY